MRILVAEDDIVSRLVLQRAVTALGHECIAAGDGQEAWELFQSTEVDVIVSDWTMPRMDGITLCERVRAQSERVQTYPYFIFLTGLAEKEHVMAAMAKGADDYLTKPLNRTDLQARLQVAERITSLYSQVVAQKEELERLNRELSVQAHRDGLTGLWNRSRLHEDLPTLHSRAERYCRAYSLVLCDVDHFKRYNDHYGHQAGDEALRIVARTLSTAVRSADAVYRYGGEELLVVLPEQSPREAGEAAERLRAAVLHQAVPHELNPPWSHITLSMGVAGLAAGQQAAPDALIKQADEALYRAKADGRNQVVVAG